MVRAKCAKKNCYNKPLYKTEFGELYCSESCALFDLGIEKEELVLAKLPVIAVPKTSRTGVNCEYCLKTFTPKTNFQIYCDNRCRTLKTQDRIAKLKILEKNKRVNEIADYLENNAVFLNGAEAADAVRKKFLCN